jgi:hypothetical protein
MINNKMMIRRMNKIIENKIKIMMKNQQPFQKTFKNLMINIWKKEKKRKMEKLKKKIILKLNKIN